MIPNALLCHVTFLIFDCFDLLRLVPLFLHKILVLEFTATLYYLLLPLDTWAHMFVELLFRIANKNLLAALYGEYIVAFDRSGDASCSMTGTVMISVDGFCWELWYNCYLLP